MTSGFRSSFRRLWARQLPYRAIKALPSVLGVLALPLVLVLMLRIGWFFLGIVLLVIILSLLITSFFPRPIGQHALESFLSSLLMWMILWFVLMALISLFMTMDWKPRATRFTVRYLHGPSSETVEAFIPDLILANADPITAVIRLNRTNTTVLYPITITFSLPAGLQTEAPDPQELTAALSDESPVLFLPLRGRVITEGLWSIQTLVLRLQNTSGAVREDRISVQLEGSWMATLRQALEGWRWGESMISMGIALVSAVGGLALQYVRERAERELRLQEHVNRAHNEFQRSFEERNFLAARNWLEQLKSPEWKDLISAAVLERMEHLIQAVEGRLSDQQLEDLLRDTARIWPKAAAVVFLHVAPLVSPQRRQVFRQLLWEDQLPPELQDEIARLNQQPLAPQPRRWPPADVLPRRRPRSRHLPESLSRQLNGVDPFPALRAEEEQDRLLDPARPAFWPHPLYERLIRSESPALVIGPPGSGRTAMALAIAQSLHLDIRRDLILYRPGEVERAEDLPEEFSRLILRFLLDHPTWLTTLDPKERSFIACFLKTAMHPEVVEAKVASTLSRLDNAQWLNEAQNKEQKDFWRQQARYGSTQFLREIQNTKAMELRAGTWPEAVTLCARILGFQQVRLVLDLESIPAAEQTIGTLKPMLISLLQAKLQWIMFLPQPWGEEIMLADQEELFWTREQLGEMIHHRYRMIIGEHRSLTEIMDEDGLDQMIKHALEDRREGAPSRLGRLWERVLETIPQDKVQITLEDVEKALNAPGS